MKRFKYFLQHSGQHWLGLLIALIFFFGVYISFVSLVRAEGSRTLYPASAVPGQDYRANIEWRNSFYANFLRRRALLKVYAEAGEVILMGSSAISVTYTHAGGIISIGDIRIYHPGTVVEEGRVGDEIIPGTPNYSCKDQRALTANPDQGRIINRTQELDGPDTIIDPLTAARGNDFPNGYVPCFYTAPTTGIYYVVFYGPAGDDQDIRKAPTGEIDLSSPANFDSNQTTSVSAWDVTVRSGLRSTADITGRLFASYLALFTGNNPRPMTSTVYVLTTDGYIYKTDLRGTDPNGFIIYANDVGFLDPDGVTPIYHDLVADSNQLDNPRGGVQLSPPTHLIFFQPPSTEAIMANGITLNPPVPEVLSIVFEGDLGGNNTTIGVGGVFTYSSNVSGTYELVISRDGVDFDPTNPLNRVLRGLRPAGTQTTIPWDGLDNAGNPFPAGRDYLVRVAIRAGEYHFPFLDVENSLKGGPQYQLTNPPGGQCPSFEGSPPNCFIAFYDDRGYTTSQGTVGTPGVVLSGTIPPDPPRSDPLAGFDTRTEQRAFGDGSQTGFGNTKGLDLWTYYPSQARNTTLNIFAFNLILSKTDGGITTTPGGVINYTLTYTNTGPVDATGVVITETVPANTRFNAADSAPTVWSCPDNSPPGTACTIGIGRLVGGTSGSANFAVTVDSPLSPGVTEIFNSAVIGDDGTNGPEPDEGDNTDDETTPVSQPPPDKNPPEEDDDDEKEKDSPTPTPLPSTPTPDPAAFAPPPPAQPTPTLPVLFLPETGTKETPQAGSIAGGVAVLLVTLSGVSLTILYVWQRRAGKTQQRK